MSSKLKNSLLSLFALFLVAIGFQNMSLLDDPELFKDLKVESPEAKYFPKQVNGRSAEEVGKEVLKHNISPLEKSLKDKLEAWKWHRNLSLSSGDEDANSVAAGYESESDDDDKNSGKWGVGITSASHYRLRYQGAVDLTCDVSALDSSYKLSVKRNISSTSDLRLVHDSKMSESSLKMNINW